jgi:hypothetical protein
LIDSSALFPQVARLTTHLLSSTKPFKGLVECSQHPRLELPHPRFRAETYARMRGCADARMRDKMIRGEVGLPYSPELEQELRTARGFLNSSGKLQIIAKDDWRR